MTQRLRLVFCIDNMGIGGTELNAVRTAERLPRDQFDVRVVALNALGPLRERYDRLAVPVEHTPIGSLYSPRTLRQIVRLSSRLRGWGTDIVHCHDRYTNFVGVLAGRLARVPLVIASKRWGETTRRHWLTSAVSFRAAHRVIANGPSTARSLQHVDHISPARIAIIPNFVDDEAFDPPDERWLAGVRAELALPANAPIAGIIASLRPVKDHATLLRAVPIVRRSVPGFLLVIVGDGPSRDELTGMCNALGISDCVRFAGIRPQLPSMHHLFDVSLLTSRTEGFPNALAEAMAASRPIVATDVTGVRDAVVHGENGLLVPAADPEGLAGAMIELLTDADTRVRMGERGRQLALERYSAASTLRALTDLYETGVRQGARIAL